MGAGKSTLGPEVAERLGRPFIDLDRDLEQDLGTTIPEFFEQRGEAEFRLQEEGRAIAALRLPDPAVIALGGGAVQTRSIRNELRDRAYTVLLEVDPGTAWQRSAGGDRPLARDESEFHALYERRRKLYEEVADGQVDAAIGGKTAIDLPQGKNLAGAFHWPVHAVIDPATLETLSEEQRAEGMAEVVKTGLLAGKPLWELSTRELVRRSAAFKAAV